MNHHRYIFQDASAAPELHRLQLLEYVFDPKTQAWLRAAGPLEARRCLEVGAGAGSTAAWLGNEVGPRGSVLAIDTNTRFLGQLAPPVQVLEGDIANANLQPESFNLAHARYVLIHNADAVSILSAMLRALEPGGTLVLEEPDFSTALALTGPEHLKSAFENIRRAMASMFAKRGMNYDFGRTLPELIRASGGELLDIEYDCPVQRGASPLAEMMRLSVLALEEQYVGTGCASASDLAAYAEFASAPECRGVYYATVRVLARKA